MSAGLRVVYRSGRRAAYDASGKMVSPLLSDPRLAAGALHRIENRATHRRRPCLRCGAEFTSTGAHHRLCDPCRARHSTLDAQTLASCALLGA